MSNIEIGHKVLVIVNRDEGPGEYACDGVIRAGFVGTVTAINFESWHEVYGTHVSYRLDDMASGWVHEDFVVKYSEALTITPHQPAKELDDDLYI